MTKLMSGVRVIEVASWTFVPAAGAVLADWGADVLKIEHPESPDPQRHLVSTGFGGTGSSKSFIMEQSNRGKRSVAVNLATPGGLELLYRLVETADVFLTNFLPKARQKLRIDVEHIRARNPRIVYTRGHGQGVHGPDADKPGYDGTAYLARGTFAHALRPAGTEWPVAGTAAVGDLPGAMTIAGGIAAGLYHRERTGEAPVVDVSLLATAMWTMSPGIVATGMYGLEDMPREPRERNANPITIYYRTKDRRFVKLSMFESDRFFADLCEHLDAGHLVADPRFADSASRSQNREACVAALDEAFEQFTLAELQSRFQTLKGAWGVVQTPRDIYDDPQVLANGYLATVDVDGDAFQLVPAPVQFDEEQILELRPCPGHGEHTDEVLLELGLSMDEVLEHKIAGDIL
jgi:crotonobetainyl-CoA:carnitine CoA-transferase CaiB-like acyl-CoA transferase